MKSFPLPKTEHIPKCMEDWTWKKWSHKHTASQVMSLRVPTSQNAPAAGFTLHLQIQLLIPSLTSEKEALIWHRFTLQYFRPAILLVLNATISSF